MSLKGLIFDLDGVLVDTVPTHFAAWSRMFHEYGYEFGKPEYRALVDGRPRYDGARAVMTNHSDEEVIEAANLKNRYYVEMIERGEFQTFESAINLVRKCVAEGYLLAAASSSANVRRVLEIVGILDAFSMVVGGDDVTKGKPNPEIFQVAAAGLGLDVSECLVIEDSVSGILAAKTGDFYCLGLAHGEDDGDLGRADRIITSLDEIDLSELSSLFSANPSRATA